VRAYQARYGLPVSGLLDRATREELRLGVDRRRESQPPSLFGARLEGAFLAGASLQFAVLIEAHLEGARLLGVQLQKADLWVAHLEEAIPSAVDLKGACFMGAHLEGADLTEAQLEGVTRLTITQLATVKSLFGASLDPYLLAQVEQECPDLLIFNAGV
jgi:uncharacterized protein YjbI with pentapeptide repeats